jgi:LPXTG-motif cell wall-anchored protein
VFGMVRRSEEVKNATGLNFVIYQNNGNWYDPEDHTDPNNPEYIPPNGSGGTGGNTGGGTNQPGGSTKPPADATSLFGIPGTNGAMPIILIILFIAAVGGGIYIFTKKRRRGGAFVK